jgi:subtilisin family serine protease
MRTTLTLLLFTLSQLHAVPHTLIKPAHISENISIRNSSNADPLFPKQWSINNYGQIVDEIPGSIDADVHLLEALEVINPQKDIIVAIIDSGLDLLHADISPEQLWINGKEIPGNGVDDDSNGYVDDIYGWDYTTSTPNIHDDMYHGTHVTGLLAATSRNYIGIFAGVPFIKVMVLKIFSQVSGTASSKQTAKAIRYAVDHGAKVISNSYGTPSYSKVMEEVITYAKDNNVLFVSAAGNSRKNLVLDPIYPSSYGVENQVVVGASNNRDLFTSFSNFGETIDIVAPGVDIISLVPNNGYKEVSGTSQACPLVSYALALTWSQYPDKNFSEIKKIVIDGADRFENLIKWTGDAGRLNILNAITNKPGLSFTAPDLTKWKILSKSIESPHPYPTFSEKEYEVTIPDAKELKIHFSRIDISFDDDLFIFDSNSNLVEILNSSFKDSWSVSVAGPTAKLKFVSRKFIRDWGFKIDQIAYR